MSESRIPHPQTPVEVRRAFQRLKDVFFDDSSDVDHDLTTNFVANEHIDHTSVTLTAGSGISGGGTIAANRTFNLDINGLAAATPAVAADTFPFYDETAGANRKITFANLNSSLDHGDLAGIAGDDHTQYLLVAGSRELSADWTTGAHSIIGSDHWYLRADNAKLFFGAADDASICYDGTDLCINPQEVGSGKSSFTGSLKLEDTTSDDTGIIYKGADRYLHNFHHPIGGGAVPIGHNLFVGSSAGNFTMGDAATDVNHASWNIGVGRRALYNNTLGKNNTAIGALALEANTTGANNSGVGSNALRRNTTGNNNFGLGYYALYANTTGHDNVAIGPNAVKSNTTGGNQIGVGNGALRLLSSGNRNTGVGYSTFYSMTTGVGNTSLGYRAGEFINGGGNNVESDYGILIGYDARPLASGGTEEIVIGKSAIGHGDNTATLGNNSSTDCYFPGDNYKLRLGVAGDASIYYDGSNLVINPKEVGVGFLSILGAVTLGGNLDVKTYKIVTTTANGDIAIEPPGSGNLTTTSNIAGPQGGHYVSGFHGYIGRTDDDIVHLAGKSDFSGTAYIGYAAAYTYISRGYTAGNATLVVGPAAMAVGQTVSVLVGDCELSSAKGGGNSFKCLTAAGSNGNFIIIGYDATTTFRDKLVVVNGASSEVYIGPYSGMFGIQGDTQKFYQGAGKDFTQWYDGTDSHLDPRNAGTGDLYLDRGSFAFTAGSAQFADITSDPTPITAHVAVYNKGGDLTVKDNDGIVSAVKDVYGSLYVSHGSLTITVTSANTAYEITTGLLTGSALQGTTFGGDHYVAVGHPGTYLINWGLSVDTTTPADEVEGGIMIDGAARDDCSSHTTIVAGAKSGAMSATCIVVLTANQQVSLFVENKTNTNDIVVEHASLTIVRVGE